MIGFIVALDSEAEGVINKIKNAEFSVKCGKKTVTGILFGKPVVLIISGIGKVNAAFSAQLIADNYPLNYFFNFGSVGGIDGKVDVLHYYAVDKCCQYDFDLSALDGVPVGYIQDYDTVYFYPERDKTAFLPSAGLATSDRFTEKLSDISTVAALDCAIFDMEGGAIAQVAKSNNIPLYIVKGVTDTHGSGCDKNTFYENLKTVCNGFAEIIERAIKS